MADSVQADRLEAADNKTGSPASHGQPDALADDREVGTDVIKHVGQLAAAGVVGQSPCGAGRPYRR